MLLQTATEGLQRLFSAEVGPLMLLRNAGMNFIDRLPVIKNVLTRYAMG